MSFQLKISNSLEKLAETLSKDLQNDGSPVLGKERIITQTTGMNRWLSITLAEKNRVFANFEFLKPNAFINKVFRLAGMEKSSFFSPENLKWPLFAILGSNDFKKRFRDIADYYKNEDSAKDDDLKKLQLAVKVADLFDQYSIYRPDYIESWNANEQAPDLKNKSRHESWQSWLWQQLKAKFPEEIENDRVTQANKLKKIIRGDQAFINTLKGIFPKISVFGLSVITPLHIELFSLLSEHIFINIYIVNPSPETYWYDTKSAKQMAAISKYSGQGADEQFFEKGNELLTNYGRILKDAFLMLFNDDTLNTLDDTNLAERQKETLLQKIQDDISRNATADKNQVSIENLADGSIQISCSYTVVRELEALHNYLLNIFEKNPGLLPKDIIVLTPDIDIYTPYISAVFNNVSKKNHIPYSIADRSYSGGDNIVGVIDLLLKLSDEEFTSERVVQLLDSFYIRNSYGITNVNLIREIVRSSYIRTGIAGDQGNNTTYVSWDYGIRRLVLGYAIQGGGAYTDRDNAIYPVDLMEGETAREGLRFIGFIDDLKKSIRARRNKRTLSGWKDYLIENIIDRFIFVKDENDREYKYIINLLASLDDVMRVFDDKIGFEVFRKSLADLLFSETRAGDFITGAVTFSRIIPMRSLPFKVVAILGLDNKKFPRVQVEPDFNLISLNRRQGDRNVKDNDKHLFLETLLAAGDNLYLSYNGYNLKDNSEMPPSILIDEIIGYIEKSFNKEKDLVRKTLVTSHPLHAFSKRYNSTDKNLYSYTVDEPVKVESAGGYLVTVEEPGLSIVSLSDLIRFFKNPFEWYYNNILKIYYREKEVLLPETEVFELGNLDKYFLKSELINLPVNSYSETLIDRYKQTGQLPLAKMAKIVFEDTCEELETIKDSFDKLRGGADEEKEVIRIKLDGSLLTGTVQGIYHDQCVSYSFSTSKEKNSSRKYNLEAWLKHLALIAAGKGKETHFLWNYNPNHIIIPANIVTQEKAKTVFSDLIELYRTGHKKILPFLPDVSFKFVFGNADSEDTFIALRKAGETSRNKTFLDEYVKREKEEGYFNKGDALYSEKLEMIEKSAKTIWLPLFENGRLFK